MGAFAFLAPERALAEAGRLDSRLARGEARDAALLGVPCPIKDLSPVAGVGFEAGSAVLRGNIAAQDDALVGWLAAAGTVMLGKTTVPEFGLPCYTEPETAAPARTPWDLSRSAGGSSGGAAAAVAAGIVPLAHGSDAGGSLRIPASACGLVGLKASRGRISSGLLREPGPGLGTDGVLSRTVRDTAVALDVLAGPRRGDTYHAPAPAGSFLAACEDRIQGLRVGVLTTPVIAADAVRPRTVSATRTAAARTSTRSGTHAARHPAITVSPGYQVLPKRFCFQLRDGTTPNGSPVKSSPVGAPKPNARISGSMRSMPVSTARP